eukprot:g15245.t1
MEKELEIPWAQHVQMQSNSRLETICSGSFAQVMQFEPTIEDKLLLLCSDGVWEFITPLEAAKLCSKFSPAEAMDAATDLAKEAWDRWIREEGGQVVDDITVVLQCSTLDMVVIVEAACRACGENLAGGLFCRSCVKRQDGYGDGAEAVMEEVTALEEALQQTVARSEGPKYDNAVTTYGIQLRAWVDMQVDARLGQLLPREFETFRSEYASAQEVASTRLEGELQAVADAQAKLLQVVDSMSRELTRVKDCFQRWKAEDRL